MLEQLFKRYVCIKQHDTTDCAVACLVSIAKYYGLKIPISKVREVSGTDKNGTNVFGLIQAATRIGFSAKGVKCNEEELYDEIPVPAIAHVVTDKGLLHYVIVYRIKQKHVYIGDPALGKIIRLEIKEFLKMWTGVLAIISPSDEFVKGDKTDSILRHFGKLIFKRKSLILNILIASILSAVLAMASSFYFKYLIDDILPNHLTKTLHIVSVGFILLNILNLLLSAFRSRLLIYLSQELDVSLFLGLYQNLLQLPMNFFGARKVGDILSRFTDLSKVRSAISNATFTILFDTILALVGGVVLYLQNAYLFTITIIVAIVEFFLVYLFSKPMKEFNRKSMVQGAELNSYVIESLNGMETIKAFNAEDISFFNTEKRFIRLVKTGYKSGMLSIFAGTVLGMLSSISNVVFLWIGSIEIFAGNLSIGQLLTFNCLMGYFLGPFKNLMNLQTTLQLAMVAGDRLGDIVNQDLEKTENELSKVNISNLKGNIEFKNVNFRYGTRQLALKNINLTINNGEKIAFVGESGSGKTTLAKLLPKFYTAECGEILINGFNIQDINLEYLRKKISYISQEVFLFSGTIKENLMLGNNQLNFEDIIKLTMKTKAHEFINDLPLRYDTVLEENGANLSGGQRQRLSIARALLKKPDILIMDEATSNLDSITEKAIETTINELTQGLTTIIIAHRLSTIRLCDKICVMDKGEIVEVGTHSELINAKGKYYELWKEQTFENTVISEAS